MQLNSKTQKRLTSSSISEQNHGKVISLHNQLNFQIFGETTGLRWYNPPQKSLL